MNTSAGMVWSYSPSGYPVEVSKKRGSTYRKYGSQGTTGRRTTRGREGHVFTVETLAELLDNGNVGTNRGVNYSGEYRAQSDSLYGNWRDNWRNTLPVK